MYSRNNAPFDVDDRVHVKVDFDLAMRVADVLLQSGTADKQVLALGHNLKNLEEDSIHRPRINKNVESSSYNEWERQDRA